MIAQRPARRKRLANQTFLCNLPLNDDFADLLRIAFQQATLLSNYPSELDALVRILVILRTLQHAGQFTHGPSGPLTDDSNLADVLRVMKAAFRP